MNKTAQIILTIIAIILVLFLASYLTTAQTAPAGSVDSVGGNNGAASGTNSGQWPNQLPTDDDAGPYACNADGKICPDGSVVGRTGPKCEFTACPSPDATSAKIVTTMGQVMTGLNVSVTPKQIISDSRCPIGVQCIWAGTVEVRTVLATQVSHGEHTLKLGEPITFGNYWVTLIDVMPAPKAGEKIPDSSYRFTYEVKKK